MELLEAIQSRRSVKKFDKTHELTDDEVRQLIRCASLAPTSFNMQNWQFVAVRDAGQKTALCKAAWNQEQVCDAALVLVLAGDLKAHEDSSRTLRDAPDELTEMFDGMIKQFYGGNESLALQEACRSVGFAGQNVMLAARDMDYDTCAMIGFDPKAVAEILELPEHLPPLLMITVGRAAEPARKRWGLLDYEEVLSLDKYGERSFTGPIQG
ncbi:MAG: nitroreductase family protein [Planctomycetota bacterium]|nr:nitroreductase family protein [Planctomycetota bacterium]